MFPGLRVPSFAHPRDSWVEQGDRSNLPLVWEESLLQGSFGQGDGGDLYRQSPEAVVLLPLSGVLEATPEAVKALDEARAQQLSELSALGIFRPLHAKPQRPRCKTQIYRESAYVCNQCQKLYHVRCLRREKDTSRTTTKEVDRQFVHHRTCHWCKFVAQRALTLEDPMGVLVASDQTSA